MHITVDSTSAVVITKSLFSNICLENGAFFETFLEEYLINNMRFLDTFIDKNCNASQITSWLQNSLRSVDKLSSRTTSSATGTGILSVPATQQEVVYGSVSPTVEHRPTTLPRGSQTRPRWTSTTRFNRLNNTLPRPYRSRFSKKRSVNLSSQLKEIPAAARGVATGTANANELCFDANYYHGNETQSSIHDIIVIKDETANKEEICRNPNEDNFPQFPPSNSEIHPIDSGEDIFSNSLVPQTEVSSFLDYSLVSNPLSPHNPSRQQNQPGSISMISTPDLTLTQTQICSPQVEDSKVSYSGESHFPASTLPPVIASEMSSNDIDEEIVASDSFVCHICDAVYVTEKALANHLETVHIYDDGIRHTCQYCGKDYASKGSLKAHTDSIHMNIIWKCRLCHINVSQKGNLKRHMNRKHGLEDC